MPIEGYRECFKMFLKLCSESHNMTSAGTLFQMTGVA